MKTWLCIDAGTTHLKLALKSDAGETLSLRSRRLESSVTEGGRSEMDMEALWREVRGGVESLAADEECASALANLAGIGVCAQGDGLWLLDGAGTPVRPAILWNDTRAKEIMERIEPESEALCAETRTVAQFAGSNAVLLRWLKEHEPENYRRGAHALHCKDWLNYRMTGRIAADPTDAGTSLLSRVSGEYDTGMLQLLGIPEALPLLPEIVPSRSIFGRVRDGALPGVPEGTPVIAGSLDVAAAAEGLGIRDAGQTLCILGTTFCVLRMIEDSVSEWPRIGSILYSLSPERSLRLLASLNGSAVLDWGRRLFGGLEIHRAEEEASRIEPGANGLCFLPFIFGERAPFRDAAASGSFMGLRAHHERAHMLRAIYEGLAMVVRMCIDSMGSCGTPEGSEVIVAGGAAGSALFCGILADLLQRSVVRRDVEEPGIEGVFSLLAGRAPAWSDAVRFEPGHGRRYEPVFDRFRTLLEQRERMNAL
jgi:sugar (pentulose or hexulose) kinase